MRYSARAFLLLVCLEFFAPLRATSQDRRLLVVSPRVGSEIDSVERVTYRLFRSIDEFQSASFYQAQDSTFWVWTMMKSPDGNLRDSAYEISYQVLGQCAERIDHQEELQQGTYALGSSPAEIFYADGGRLVPPSVTSVKGTVVPRRVFDDILPLASSVGTLARPRFRTPHLELSAGVSTCDFSGLEILTTKSLSNTRSYIPLSITMDLPFGSTSPISLFSSFGFAIGGAGGGSLAQYSVFLMFRASAYSSFNPILGIGATLSNYSSELDSLDRHAFDVSVRLVSPTIVLGLELVPDWVDILLTVPLRTNISTAFESKSYTVQPVGIQMRLLVSLR